MAIIRERFDLALERLKAADWEQFEHLASTFLASEYNQLRTMAAPSGDGGRDSELFSEIDNQVIAFQYSVTEDWSGKIRRAVKRLADTFPNTKVIVYLTNQIVGAQADALRRELRREGYSIDILDRPWFLERANTTHSRESAAEALATRFVDPLISKPDLDKDLVAYSSSEDSKTALLFLEMQIQDSNRSYGLTKSSYNALTLAALRGSDTTNRLGRQEVYKRVEAFLPSHPSQQIRARVDAALVRLKDAVRHRTDRDEFHLNDKERDRVSGLLARISKLKTDFEIELKEALATFDETAASDCSKFLQSARVIIETYFLRKGEDFAQAALISAPHKFDEITLKAVVLSEAKNGFGIKVGNPVQTMLNVLQSVLNSPGEGTASYLGLLLKSYTLFAFLAATPDVQRATKDMFGGGEIWLDASVILPLLAEASAPAADRPFTEMFKQAKAANLKLYVTDGILEEVERHINRCKVFIRTPNWNGSVPYLYFSYVQFGGRPDKFGGWAERFIGDVDPIQDLADYLRINHRIYVGSADAHPNVPENLARAIRAAWQSIHEARRENLDGNLIQAFRLAAHDAENYLHILSSRIGEKGRAPLGYSDWWLTLDRRARDIWDMIPLELRPRVNVGPIMSIDYLIRYLAFGPNREKVDLTGGSLARVYTDVLFEPASPELLHVMERIREENKDLPENIVQRRIRDKLNVERSRMGEMDSVGIDGAADALRKIY
jgi:hypothetical protein